jgi:glycosyltransferase involved in cell wall biosynthesis
MVFAEVIEQFPDARMIIGGNGPEKTALERQASDLGVSHAVDFIGWVDPDSIPSLLKSVTALLLPSRYEGLPVVAIQSALMARPIVAMNVGGIAALVKNRQTGFLVEEGDMSAFLQGILNLLEQPNKAKEMGRRAREWAKESFSWAHHVDAYDQLYRKLISQSKAT